MKKIIVITTLILTSLFFIKNTVAQSKRDAGINWISFEELEKKMAEEPKKVLIDVYTSWCGWCKKMDKDTYANPYLIKFVNENFYAIKFNAEQKETIKFMNRDWEFVPANKAHQLAIELLQGKMSYPSTVILEEGFKGGQAIPGYMEVFKMEGILKFFASDQFKTISWNDFQRDFKSEWKR